MLFRFPLFASLAFFRVLSLCAVVKVRIAIPENDIVFQDFQDSQYLYCAGLAPAVRLHPLDARLILILLSGFRASSSRSLSLRSTSALASVSLSPSSRPRAMKSAKTSCLPRKEVIQPHLPIRLPCYDFTPVIDLTFGSWSLPVTSLTSGALNSHGVTGGVYKARERIHRDMLIRDY